MNESEETQLKSLINYYIRMYTIRRTEETLLDLFSRGLLMGTTHTCIGQEACAVGVISAIDISRDVIVSNHRAHGHFLAYCGDLTGLFSEVMGKQTGVCGGMGGSQHLQSKNFYTNGIQGGIAPVATGMALAEKAKGSGAIVLVFLGDGTFGQGAVYEALNIASLWKLPMIFVVEHNKYAQSTPAHLQHGGDFLARGSCFGIKSESLEVRNVEEVNRLAGEAVRFVRERQEPFFMLLHTYRFAPHSKGDDFRSKEEIDLHRKDDPVMSLRNRLVALKVDVEALENDIERDMQTALERAKKAPITNPECMFDNRRQRLS